MTEALAGSVAALDEVAAALAGFCSRFCARNDARDALVAAGSEWLRLQAAEEKPR